LSYLVDGYRNRMNTAAIIASVTLGIAVVVVLAGFVWAALEDGRAERRSRRRRAAGPSRHPRPR
jgi:hypothetical protein